MSMRAQRIAIMMGRTAYRDLRQGFGGGLAYDSDADIKCAWGEMAHRCGPVCEQAFITKYASSLRNEPALRRAWWTHAKGAFASRGDRGAVHIYRIAGSLAVRQLAGLKIGSEMLREWAWLAHTSQPYFAEIVGAATYWLEDRASVAKRAFEDALPSDEDKCTEALAKNRKVA
jgi:hypothetical protein